MFLEVRFDFVRVQHHFIEGRLNITGYNGAFPGPTIRVKAGDTLTLNLNNNLENVNNVVKALNIMDLPNTTVSVTSLIVVIT